MTRIANSFSTWPRKWPTDKELRLEKPAPGQFCVERPLSPNQSGLFYVEVAIERLLKFLPLDLKYHAPRRLLPLDGAGRFAADVVDHAGNTGDFVDDAGGNALEDIAGETYPIGGHGVIGLHYADGNGQSIGATIAHDADAADGEEHSEGLPHFFVEPGAAYFFDNDGVGFAESY